MKTLKPPKTEAYILHRKQNQVHLNTAAQWQTRGNEKNNKYVHPVSQNDTKSKATVDDVYNFYKHKGLKLISNVFIPNT